MAYESIAVDITTSDTDIFEMPATFSGLAVLAINNKDSSSRTYGLKFYRQAPGTTKTLLSAKTLAANSVEKYSVAISMEAGDKLIANASANSAIVVTGFVTTTQSAAPNRGFQGQGTWSSGSTYAINDIVTKAVSGRTITYLSLQGSNTNQDPETETDYWMVILDPDDITDVLLTSDIGTTVQGYDADTAKTDVAQTFTAKQTLTGGVSLEVKSAIIERANIVADNLASGDNNFDVVTNAIWYWTTAGDTNATLNFRGDGSTTLNSLMDTGDIMTLVALVVHTGTAYLINAFKIDGSSVTPKYSDGVAPSAGSVNAVDAYRITIIKTANATFTVLVSRQKWDEV